MGKEKSMENEQQSSTRRRVFTVVGLLLALILIGLGIFGFYRKNQQDQVVILDAEEFTVHSESENLTLAAVQWLSGYLEQYQVAYLPRKERLMDFAFRDIEEKETGSYPVVLCEFTIQPAAKDLGDFSSWGIAEEDHVSCQWVLWMERKALPDGGYLYGVRRQGTPASYDLEQYQGGSQQEKDEYDHEYKQELPYERNQYTYKIQDGACSVSLDGGNGWQKIPLSLETLCEVGDGNAYYNRLQEGSFLITPEKTAFAYGGTVDTGLSVIYSEDQGKSWKTALVDEKMDSVRVKFLSFPTPQTGFLVATGGRTMSQEGQVIYRTQDGGASWQRVGEGPRTSLLQSAGFVSETVGFLSYPPIEGAEANLYRTEDAGQTFSPIQFPVKDEWKEVFVAPTAPFMEDGKLVMLVGQGDSGDFEGGRVMAKYVSEDMGLTWTYADLYEPPDNEPG
ncbi:WD40/YVTN/BNR-like repeat-containing protein [Zongyangia hominis]|uniref:Photosynthesis system II assembly factor Ycf48/Hcf136-like domain-containing protein n=1 Tax=Zongyangia hominis TaxID=2763677 RepID=A0A926EAT5_9FIRM|nr:hypothetical protein [Zongyangia hominis]MBC8570373.1 hypothetical protein [Zongyangia hominis]